MLLHEPLEYWATRSPDQICLIEGTHRTTYGRAQDLVTRVSARLTELGLSPDTRIAILGQNATEVPLLMFAASRAGLVPVPMNPRLAPPECAYILNDADVAVVFAGSDLTGTIDKVRPELRTVTSFVSWGEGTMDGWDSWDDWLAGSVPHPPALRDPDDDAYQIYTSGTTGRPKGVVHSHSSLAALLLRWDLCGMYVRPGEIFHLSMPTTLAAGLSQALNTIYAGGTLHLAKFDPPATLRELADGNVVATALAPTMIHMLLRADDGSADFGALRWILYGAAPMPVNLLREAMDRFGCDFFQGYGQSEAPAFTMMTPEDHRSALAEDPRRLGSLGRAQIGCRVAILDESDVEAAVGEPGEICARGPLVMKGYWHLPDKTAETSRAGWHHTGDYGYVDERGDLYMIDRLSNVILSGGYNIYPREVEQVLESFPEVEQVAVVGMADEVWGQSVAAVLTLRNGHSITADELQQRCRANIASYKVPRTWWLVADFPVNANGKVMRHVLAESLAKTGRQL